MDLTIGHYLTEAYKYQNPINGHKVTVVETDDIDVDSTEDDDVPEKSQEDEAKILQTNGRKLMYEKRPGTETVEICQRTVNPHTKVDAEDFKILKTIGKGAYGTVFLVQKLNEPKKNDLFAMKVLKKAKITCNEKDTAHTVSERNILEMLRHPFLVKLYYAFQSQSYLYIVLEYCPGGELFNYLEKIVYLKEDSACFYVSEIALAIGHLHSLGIIYRDLKSENILLDKEGHVKLTDFGLSKEGTSTTNTFCGTIEYMAPEIIRCAGHGKEVDWWSLGTLLYDMLSGGPPFYQDKNKCNTAQSILHADVKYPATFSPEVRSLLGGLLTREPSKRLGSQNDVEDIKRHAFFKKHNIDWQQVFERKLKPPFEPVLESATDVSMFDQNFTNLNPTVSPADAKASVPADLFKGFSYVAKSFCDQTMRFNEENAHHLRTARRDHLFGLSQSQQDGGNSITRSPFDHREKLAGLMEQSVEPAADCLLMEVDSSTGYRKNRDSIDDNIPGAQQIPTSKRQSFASGSAFSPPKRYGTSACESSNIGQQSTTHVNGGNGKGPNQSGCLLM